MYANNFKKINTTKIFTNPSNILSSSGGSIGAGPFIPMLDEASSLREPFGEGGLGLSFPFFCCYKIKVHIYEHTCTPKDRNKLCCE